MAFNANEHLIDLKGKQYLQVMWRLVWFREEKPHWCIDTKLERLENNHAVFSAKICDENGVQKASGYGSESMKDFRDFIEKAETKAIGRALAMLGYGTQFAPELDEEERIVDSPVDRGGGKPPVCYCEDCTQPIQPVKMKDGTVKDAQSWAAYTKGFFGKQLCKECYRKAADAAKAAAQGKAADGT